MVNRVSSAFLIVAVISFFTVFGLFAVNADLDTGRVSIPNSYGPGQTLEGSFDLRLITEPANTPLTITLERDSIKINKTVPLIEFLRKSNANFSCDTKDCSPKYRKISPSKSIDIGFGERYIGLVINIGNDTQINSLEFRISGNGTSESCGISPVTLDLLEDGIIDWQYTKPGKYICGDPFPGQTYSPSKAKPDYEVGEIPYCEKIKMPRGSKYRIGVDMVNASPLEQIIMSLNDLERGENAECSLVPGNGIRMCEVNFSVFQEKDLYVCVQSFEEGNYKIKAETSSPNCGKFGLEEFDCGTSLIDYAIFAEPAAFKVFDERVSFDLETFSQFNPEDLAAYLQEYIDLKYSASCDNGCIIPLRVSSAQDRVTLSDLIFRYQTTRGFVAEDDFYELEREEAKINMSFTEMQLSKAGFSLPSLYGNYRLRVSLGDEEIEDTNIRIEEVPIIESVKPLRAFAEVDTEFSAIASSPKNNTILLYEWDFGDGFPEVTGVPFATHRYPFGVFSLKITATDNEGLKATRSFDITTMQPREAVLEIIKEKKDNLLRIVNEIDSLPEWHSDLAKSAVNLEKIGADLKSLEEESQLSGADYASIKRALDDLPVYYGIRDDVSGIAIEVPSINLNYLKSFGEAIDSGREEQTAKDLEAWLAGNLEIRSRGTIKSAVADTKKEDDVALATVFEVTLGAINLPRNNVYLIIENPEGFSFEDFRFRNMTVRDLNGAAGIVLARVEQETVFFALPGKVEISELKVFASPTLQGLVQPDVYCGNNICEKSFGENYNICPEDCSKPISYAAILSALVIVALITGIYFIWKYYAIIYEKKQMKKLFTKEEDFYSLTFFIANEINKGTEEKKVREMLEKAEWKPSQVDFGMRKVKEQTKRTQKNSILNFVIEEMSSGKRPSQIKAALAKAGWKSTLVNWALKKAKKQIKAPAARQEEEEK